MISEFANKEATEAIMSRSPELQRFVFEFCKAFDCRVGETNNFNQFGNHGVQVLTKTGLPCGYLYVNTRGAVDKEGNHTSNYNYKSPIVEKERSSRNAGRDTRDSVKISSLIAAVRKCGEEPTDGGLARHYRQAIRYAHRAAGSNSPAVRIDMPADAIVALTEYYIGETEMKSSALIESVRASYNTYLRRKKQAAEGADTAQRFWGGAYTIGVMGDHDKRYYIVGNTKYDDQALADECVTFQGDLKRYSSLYECPELAMHVPIIRAWAEGQNEFDQHNDLGLPRRDIYYPDIDVASGYATTGQTWFLIPHKAP